MSRRALLILLAAHVLAGWLFLRDCGPGFPLDDAWGHLVYAEALALGEGFAYNPGQPEAGVSSPLWTALAAGPAALVAYTNFVERPDFALRLLGGLCGFLAAAVACRLALRAGRWPMLFVGLVLTFDPLMLASRFSGMELPLFALLALWLLECVLDDRPVAAGWATGLALLTRPEGLLLGAVALLVLARRGERPLRFLWPVVLCALPFAAFNQWIAGHPWPNTWHNKTELVLNLSAIWDTLGALGRDTGWVWSLPLLLLVGAIALEGAAGRLARLALLFAGLLLLGVLLTRAMPVAGSDPPRVPFYWQRYAVLAWPLLLLVAGTGLASVMRTAWAGCLCRPRACLVLVAPAAAAFWLGAGLPAHAVDVRQRFAAECADVEALNVAAGLWIDEHVAPGALVASHDAGAIRYFGKRPLLDLYGNNDARLARLIDERLLQAELGNPQKLAAAEEALLRYLSERAPVALAVFPHWAAGHSPEFKALFDKLSESDRAALAHTADDYAHWLGLTQRAALFRVPHPAVVPSPLHQSLEIWVAP
ncbi:MAG: hypothetical protein ACT4PU_09475 [Planctomycetota bacterium]